LQCTQNKFAQIWAIEPDSNNYSRLCEFVNTLGIDEKDKIKCLNIAVAQHNDEINFQADATEGSRYCPGSLLTVPAKTLDSLFINDKVTFIKFDIEGLEKEALLGGQRLIIEQKPTLAVSVYHCPDDIWQIPIYLKSLNKDYKLFLRTEGEDGMGTICYAI
jgi:FkbM family methyltransferase